MPVRHLQEKMLGRQQMLRTLMQQGYIVHSPGSTRSRVYDDRSRIDIRILDLSCSRLNNIRMPEAEIDFPHDAVLRKGALQDLQPHFPCQQCCIQRNIVFINIILRPKPFCQIGIVRFVQNGQQILICPDRFGMARNQTVHLMHNSLVELACQLAGTQIKAVLQPKICSNIPDLSAQCVAATDNLDSHRRLYIQLHAEIRNGLKEQ